MTHNQKAFLSQNTIERVIEGAKAGSGYAAWKLGNWYFDGKAIDRDLETAMYWYASGIENGSSLCMQTAAKMVFSGLVPGDFTQANGWLRGAAQLGDGTSIYELAVSLMHGRGTNPDINEAINLLRQAASLDHTDAKIDLAYIEATGLVPCLNKGETCANLNRLLSYGDPDGRLNYALAMLLLPDISSRNILSSIIECLEFAFNKGHTSAAFELGNLFRNDNFAIKNTDRSYIYLSSAAEKGHSEAKILLAKMILDGETPVKDKSRAYEHLVEAWENGNLAAGWDLSKLGIDGFSIPESAVNEPNDLITGAAFAGVSDALDWLVRDMCERDEPTILPTHSVEQIFELCMRYGMSYAASFAAWYYDRHAHSERKTKLKLSWLECGRDDDSTFSTFSLSVELAQIASTPTELAEATSLLVEAAELNCTAAQSQLGYNLLTGDSIIKNKSAAAHYLELAASAGDVDSIRNLGLMLYNGDGIPIDIRRGRELLLRADELILNRTDNEESSKLNTLEDEQQIKSINKRGDAKVLSFDLAKKPIKVAT